MIARKALSAITVGLIFGFLAGCPEDEPTPAPVPDAAVDQDVEIAPDAADDIQEAIEVDSEAPADEGVPGDTEEPPLTEYSVTVLVTVDGAPTAGVRVSQGGSPLEWLTGEDGTVVADLDLSVPGSHALLASHPECRIGAVQVAPLFPPEVTIALTRYDTTDNEDYVFLDPGDPGDSWIIEKCGHCHITIQETWYDSTHRHTASNPTVRDVYDGTAAAASTEAQCQQAGGAWKDGLQPGTLDTLVKRCYVADSVPSTGSNGECADCHAPGIDGKLGGRGLEEATGLAYDYGIHCDVCHKVNKVNPEGAPGIGGFLEILRPSEAPKFADLGAWAPMLFGPNNDVGNVLMGSVQRDHYQQSVFCAGCHEHERAALGTGTLDTARWPSGKLPIQSTFTEWTDGPLAGGANCQSCHMPFADDEVTNGADLQLNPPGETGLSGGWIRAGKTTRKHLWTGPSREEGQEGGTMLKGSAVVSVDSASVENGSLEVSVSVTNTVVAHAFPTGEPFRSLVLQVEARCGETALPATGGAAIPDFGGYLARQEKGADWSHWPGAKVGQQVTVIARPGGHHDYAGWGPFGDGTFDAAQKGMPVEQVVGSAKIASVTDGKVSFETPLPEGDVAYLTHGAGLPVEGEGASARAGAAGFAFARVLVSATGERMVHHWQAVDIASDNRLLPGVPWTSQHTFAAGCEEPTVTAVLTYRAYPWSLADQRGWTLKEQVVTQDDKIAK